MLHHKRALLKGGRITLKEIWPVKITHLAPLGVRKEVIYSKPSSNSKNKAHLSLLKRIQLRLTDLAHGHLNLVWNN